MGEEPSSSVAPRKMKFAPKIPPRKTSKPPVPKAEKSESNEGDVTDLALLRRVKQAEQGPGRRSPMERKAATMEVALGHVGPRTSAMSFGVPRNKKSAGGPDTLGARQKDYVEPWNYYSNYPVVLPLRRPYSGNPEVLDIEEFGEASAISEYDETRINCAEELGLKDDSTNGSRMLFLQLPASLPLGRTPDSSAKGKEIEAKGVGMLQKGHSLDDLPAGFMGKMLVYKSGAVKMKLGDAIFDVRLNPAFFFLACFSHQILRLTTYLIMKCSKSLRGICRPSLARHVAPLCIRVEAVACAMMTRPHE